MITIFSEGFALEVPIGMILTVLITSLIIPLAFYVLRSIGLYKLAKRKNLKCAFMAFIPCVWIYVACRLVAESKFFEVADSLMYLFRSAVPMAAPTVKSIGVKILLLFFMDGCRTSFII